MIELKLSIHLPGVLKESEQSIDPEDFILNQGMIALEKFNHSYFVELYNQLPQSTLFYQILSNQEVVAVINTLLGKRENENLYINSMSVRMDPPGKSPYILGWHRDDNSNIPNSNFIQFWAPPIQNLNNDLGGIFVLEGSHLENLSTTDSISEKNKLAAKKPIRTPFETEIIGDYDKSKECYFNFTLGECLFFNKSLMHKSGFNSTKDRMRYALTAFYHDVQNKDWQFMSLDQKNN
jgi:ectoine hydroxylase-related dioxygenase (phytanoyl-CoA dioxygenase family)